MSSESVQGDPGAVGGDDDVLAEPEIPGLWDEGCKSCQASHGAACFRPSPTPSTVPLILKAQAAPEPRPEQRPRHLRRQPQRPPSARPAQARPPLRGHRPPPWPLLPVGQIRLESKGVARARPGHLPRGRRRVPEDRSELEQEAPQLPAASSPAGLDQGPRRTHGPFKTENAGQSLVTGPGGGGGQPSLCPLRRTLLSVELFETFFLA